MSEKRFVYGVIKGSRQAHIKDCHTCKSATIDVYDDDFKYFVDVLNEQQELIEELHISDNMGWGRAEKFEKELKQKKIYIKRLEYKVQKFKEMNNEQQATITKLEQICETKMQEIEDIKYGLKEIAYKYQKELQFKADTDPNQAVKEVLGEQQATIRRLQDLCGESDGENAKLRIENKMLEKEVNLLRPTNIEQYEQIQKLQQENEQLKAKLREKEEDEQLYANEIVKLNKEAKEVLDFKSLGGDY